MRDWRVYVVDTRKNCRGQAFGEAGTYKTLDLGK
jgi:hypothetical protein